MKKREALFPYPARTRLDAATKAGLQAAVDDRGCDESGLIRLLIQHGLATVDTLDPVRRKRAPVRSSKDLARIAMHLGSIAGNLQRTFTLMKDRGREDLELLDVKIEVQAIARLARQAIGEEIDP